MLVAIKPWLRAGLFFRNANLQLTIIDDVLQMLVQPTGHAYDQKRARLHPEIVRLKPTALSKEDPVKFTVKSPTSSRLRLLGRVFGHYGVLDGVFKRSILGKSPTAHEIHLPRRPVRTTRDRSGDPQLALLVEC
jgi:hypothetical protein